MAKVVVQLLSDRSNPELCLQATLALSQFTDVPEVMTALGDLVVADRGIDWIRQIYKQGLVRLESA